MRPRDASPDQLYLHALLNSMSVQAQGLHEKTLSDWDADVVQVLPVENQKCEKRN